VKRSPYQDPGRIEHLQMRQPLHDPPQRPPSSPFALGSFFSFCRPFCPSARKFGERIFMRCAALAVSACCNRQQIFSPLEMGKRRTTTLNCLETQPCRSNIFLDSIGNLVLGIYYLLAEEGQACSPAVISILTLPVADRVTQLKKKKKKNRICAFLCERFCRGAA
jgi:hypothetical protein